MSDSLAQSPNREVVPYVQAGIPVVRPLVLGQHSTGVPEVAHQHGNAQPVVISTVLPHKGKIGFGERGQANQLLNLVAKATPFTPMTECAAHVAHGAKYKGSDVKITEIQEVKKNR